MLLPRVDRWLAWQLGGWARRSQLGSRRNAMVAATALAQRRIERDDVEDYLRALAAPCETEVTTAAR